MQDLKISFENENRAEVMECLTEAANEIFKETQKDFEEIKNTKWYKRLWQLITFSKENQKKSARGVSNLAKLQEIVMKALLILSDESAEMANVINAHADYLEKISKDVKSLSENFMSIINAISRIKLGVKEIYTIDKLTENEHVLFISALARVADDVSEYTDASKRYFNALLLHSSQEIQDVNFSEIENLNTKQSNLLYRTIMEYVYLARGDFEWDGELLDYININKRQMTKTKEQIEWVVRCAGEDALITKTEDDEYIYLDDIDFDWIEEIPEEEQFSAVEEEPEELEDYIISEMLHIDEEEVVVFKHKNIIIKSFINCRGRMELYNCLVTYNCFEDYADEIVLEGEESSFLAVDTVFVCAGADDRAFITSKGANISFENCIFEDCSYFCEVNYGAKEFTMNNCTIRNCGNAFVNVYGDPDCTIESNYIENTCLADFNKEKDWQTLFDLTSEETYIRKNVVKESDNFRNKDDDDTISYLYFQSYSGVVNECTFENAQNCLKALQIEDCLFKNCVSPVSTNTTLDYKSNVKNCVFDGCKHTLKLSEDTNVSKCKFLNCKGDLINGESAYDGGVTIEFCEFVNCDGTGVDTFLEHSLITLCRTKSSSAKSNTITRCVFDGISLNKSFLIGAHIFEKPSGTVLYVEDCNFRNCTTKRESEKIIREYDSYHNLFGKEMTVKTTQISGCRGIDKVNKQNSYADDDAVEKVKAAIPVAAAALLGGLPLAIPVATAKVLKRMKAEQDRLSEQASKE